MNNLQAFRRPPLQQPTRPGWELALCIVLAAALLLAGCGTVGSAVGEGAVGIKAESDRREVTETRSVDRKNGQDTGSSEKAGLRVHLGGVFEPNLEKTEIWPVCDRVTDEFLDRHKLVFEPASTGAFGKNQRGIQSCTFMYGAENEGVIVLSTNLVTAQQRREQLEFIKESDDPRLPDAILLTSPELSTSSCEATMDTSRGRIAVGGAFIDPEIPLDIQCQLSLDILYDLVSLSKGEFA